MTMPRTFPTSAQVERAEPLSFERPAEKQANIQIEVSPAGVTVVVEYTGAVSGIAAALDRLRTQGVFDLVEKSRPAEQTPAPIATPARKAHRERVEPQYRADGTPTCPAHHKPLLEGQRGLYCPARAKPGEEQNAKGYCSLVFAE